MRTFPIMLAVDELKAVVVGGGAVGLRKAKALVRAGADVTLVDPRGAPGNGGGGKAARLGVRLVRSPYRRAMLRGARLVLACTDSREVNRRVAADARAAGALVNAADQPEDCDFYLPAVLADGDVVVAIGTGGAAPAVAAQLKRTLKKALPRRIGRFTAELARLRRRLKEEVPDPRRRMAILRRLSRGDVYDAFVREGPRAILSRATRLIGRAARGKTAARRDS